MPLWRPEIGSESLRGISAKRLCCDVPPFSRPSSNWRAPGGPIQKNRRRQIRQARTAFHRRQLGGDRDCGLFIEVRIDRYFRTRRAGSEILSNNLNGSQLLFRLASGTPVGSRTKRGTRACPSGHIAEDHAIGNAIRHSEKSTSRLPPQSLAPCRRSSPPGASEH